MQILPFLSKKGVDVYDHEDLQEAAVDLGVITGVFLSPGPEREAVELRTLPMHCQPLDLNWPHDAHEEQKFGALYVCPGTRTQDDAEPADEPKATRCCPNHREPGEARYGCATAPGVTDPCCNDCHYWVAWNRYLDGDDDDDDEEEAKA